MTDAPSTAVPATPTERHVTFDLATGKVRSSGDERLVFVPPSALDDLASSVGVEAASRFARAIGVAVGQRVARKLGSSEGVLGASLEAFVSELALEVALSGWGSVRIERWGRAMVVVVEHAPISNHRLIAALIEGAIEAAAGRAVHGVSLGREQSGEAGAEPARVLVVSETTAERARGWMAEGASGQEILARLQAVAPARSDA
jgi:hypothetical protein